MSHNRKKLERLIRWLKGHKDEHDWEYYTRINTKRHIIFYCRKCECGLEQVQHKISRDWRDTSSPWNFDWEKDWFDNSISQTD